MEQILHKNHVKISDNNKKIKKIANLIDVLSYKTRVFRT